MSEIILENVLTTLAVQVRCGELAREQAFLIIHHLIDSTDSTEDYKLKSDVIKNKVKKAQALLISKISSDILGTARTCSGHIHIGSISFHIGTKHES